MSPLAVLQFGLAHWKLILVLALVSALGVQTYRLQGKEAERAALAQEKVERERRDALRAAANQRNKERTDEEHAAARARAAAVRVRVNPSAGIVAGPAPVLAAGRDGGPAVCLDRGRINQELAEFSRRHAEGVAEAARRHAERLEGIAREGEAVAAGYRACRAWALSLANGAPPGVLQALGLAEPGPQAWQRLAQPGEAARAPERP
jgi:hypothetical protein